MRRGIDPHDPRLWGAAASRHKILESRSVQTITHQPLDYWFMKITIVKYKTRPVIRRHSLVSPNIQRLKNREAEVSEKSFSTPSPTGAAITVDGPAVFVDCKHFSTVYVC